MLKSQLNSKIELSSLYVIWDLDLINNTKWTGTKKVAVSSSFDDLYTDDKIRNHTVKIKYLKVFRILDVLANMKIFQ